jgi:hypothetical protein
LIGRTCKTLRRATALSGSVWLLIEFAFCAPACTQRSAGEGELVFGSHQAGRDIHRGVLGCQPVILVILVVPWAVLPMGLAFWQEGYAVPAQIGRKQARSDPGPSRKRRWPGALRHSGLAAWGCVSAREHVFVVGPRVHVVTRFVNVGPRSVRWRSSGRRVLSRAQVAENLLHQARITNSRDDARSNAALRVRPWQL